MAFALAGVLAGVAGVATSQAFVWAADGGESPLIAVASAVRDLTPGALAVWLVELVGHWDKPLLRYGTTAGLLGLCAWAGTLSRRHALLSDLVFCALAGAGLLALLRLPNETPVALFSVLVGLVTWIVALRMLTAPYLGAQDVSRTRRQFLIRSGSVAAGAVGIASSGWLLGRGRRKVEQARRLLRLPVTRGVAPEGADLTVAGVARWRTPNHRFYEIATTLSPPAIAPHDWTLRVHGMVERELSLTYDDLLHRKMAEGWVTLCCVSNPVGGNLVGNAWWSGVPVREILEEAGVMPGADAVLQSSHDGWNCATPLAALTDERNSLLAIAMNGRPLPVRHGFPVRMVVPGLYGYVSATKWLVDLEVTRFDEVEAYWTQRGWAERGPVKTQSRIDVPRQGSRHPAGRLAVGGVAWAQHTGIAKVEVQLDGGPWQEAILGQVPNVDTWVQWTAGVDVEPGDHTLVVRATDRDGDTQTAAVQDVLPDGATGWHGTDFVVEEG